MSPDITQPSYLIFYDFSFFSQEEVYDLGRYLPYPAPSYLAA